MPSAAQKRAPLMPSRIECLRGQRKQRRLLSVLYNILSLLPKIKCEVGVKSGSGQRARSKLSIALGVVV